MSDQMEWFRDKRERIDEAGWENQELVGEWETKGSSRYARASKNGWGWVGVRLVGLLTQLNM